MNRHFGEGEGSFLSILLLTSTASLLTLIRIDRPASRIARRLVNRRLLTVAVSVDRLDVNALVDRAVTKQGQPHLIGLGVIS